MKPRRTQKKRPGFLRNWRVALRICLALLSIPLIAWTVEYVYHHFISPAPPPQKDLPMVLTNHGLEEGYSYSFLNSLLRKYRRFARLRARSPQLFLSNPRHYVQLSRLIMQLEDEHKKFTNYYYDIVDMYSKTSMPLKLRRRLTYYRHMIRRTIGQVRHLHALFEESARSPAQHNRTG